LTHLIITQEKALSTTATATSKVSLKTTKDTTVRKYSTMATFTLENTMKTVTTAPESRSASNTLTMGSGSKIRNMAKEPNYILMAANSKELSKTTIFIMECRSVRMAMYP